MREAEFFATLRERLKGMNQEDLERSLEYYREMIADSIEDGMTEDEAVEALGSMDEIVASLQAGSAAETVQEAEPTAPNPPQRRGARLRWWHVLLIVLGSPIWLSIAAALLALLIALYVVLWAVVLVFWAVDAALYACGVALALKSLVAYGSGLWPAGMLLFGAGMVLFGLAVFWMFLSALVTKGIAKLSRAIMRGIIRCFRGRRG